MTDLTVTDDSTPRSRIARALDTAAMLLLLAVMTARPFLSEMPFHTSALSGVMSAGAGAKAGGPAGNGDSSVNGESIAPLVDRAELSRVAFAIAIFAAGAIWLTGRAISGRLVVRCGGAGVLMAGFIVLTFISAIRASDVRAGLDCWVEQASLLTGFFLAIQLFADRRRFFLLLAVLAAIGGTVACKAFYQAFIENPERLADFLANRDQQLASAGIAPGSPQAAAFENRVADMSVLGFGGLSNLLASLVLVLAGAAVGLALDKLRAAWPARAAWRAGHARNEIHLPTLAAVLTALVAGATVVALVQTHSRAGIAFGGLAVAAGVLVGRFGEPLAAHWRRNVAIAGVVFLLGIGGVVAYGAAKDSLPSTSMTFRWYYWTASAQITAEHPVLGVGPGNFPAAYLHVRRPAAEESVKMPHNFIVHAFSEYGLPAGACYIALVAVALVGVARPCVPRASCPRRMGKTQGQDGPATHGLATASQRQDAPATAALPWWMLLVPLAALPVGSVLYNGANVYCLYNLVLPMLVFPPMLAIAAWTGRRLAASVDIDLRFSRIALGCGLAAMVLHNLVEFSLFVPSAAAVFWVAGGAVAAQGAPGRVLDLTKVRWVKAASAWALVVLMAAFLLWPVDRKTELMQAMVEAYHAGDARAAFNLAQQAATADPLDPEPAMDAARLAMPISLDQARGWADAAIARDRADYATWRLAADAALYSRFGDAYLYTWSGIGGNLDAQAKALEKALQRQPSNVAVMSRLAGVYFAAGRYEQAAELCRQAAKIDERSGQLLIHLGDCLSQLGRQDQASENWRKAEVRKGLVRQTDSVGLMREALARNPNDLRLNIDYAQMLAWGGLYNECLDQIEHIRTLDAQLLPGSIEHLSKLEHVNLDLLQRRAQCMGGQAG